MKRAPNHDGRRKLLLGGLLLGTLVVLGRGVDLQLLNGGRWSSKAADQQSQQVPLPAPRGAIYDRHGLPLATSQVAYRISIAPQELRDRAATAKRLREVLGMPAAEANRAVDRKRRWVVLPGRYDAVVRQRLGSERGVHFEQVLERFYPHGEVALELLGRVSAAGEALGGIELAFDSLLTGKPGLAVRRRDARGQPIPGSLLSVAEPAAGHDLYLTLDLGLQEIAHEALKQAVAETGSLGGELLFADPRTGEILAAVSQRAEGSGSWRAALEPYEPGSTFKPFFVSTLLGVKAATLEDSIFAENGRFTHEGRTVSDVHGYGWLTLKDALAVSSNVVMVKLSERLEPADQFRTLRDFGFGSPTGVPYPAEASGLLRRPRDWSRFSQGSLAIGYEVSVTPLQMVMAYGALANGGVLMEPRLVREVRTREGRRVARYEPRAVRRVVAPELAKAVSAALVDVVEAGSGRSAALGPFRVAGKTGTARRFVGGRYESGGYTASFAGFFPAEDPQLSFLVKLDRPQGAYYGGAAAAPVTRATLAAALAARSTVLDRRAVAQQRPAPAAPVGGEEVRRAAVASAGGWASPASGPFIFTLDGAPPERYRPSPPRPRPVPELRGLAVRDAARRLHAVGFRVEVEGGGAVVSTHPVPGEALAPGAVVRIRAEEVR